MSLRTSPIFRSPTDYAIEIRHAIHQLTEQARERQPEVNLNKALALVQFGCRTGLIEQGEAIGMYEELARINGRPRNNDVSAKE